MATDILSALNTNGSGLNLRDLAQTLAKAETTPQLTALQTRVAQDSVKLSALGQIRAQFDTLGGVLAEVAGNPVLTVSTTSGAVIPRVIDRNKLQGSAVPIEVQSLATRQVLEFPGFASGTEGVQAGRLTLEFGPWDGAAFNPASREAVVLDIPEGATLQDVAAQLSSVAGLTARVLDKGDGTFSLGLVGEFGAANGLRITAAPAGGTGRSLAAFDTTATNAERQVQAAADARLRVDGIALSRPTNVLTDLLPGMEITLSAPATATLSVDRDAGAARANLEKLVAGLNDTFSLLRGMTGRGAGGTEVGALPGDRSLESVEQALRRLVAAPLAGHGARAVTLAELGVATQRDGLLRFDPPAFDRAFAARAAEFDALFGDTLRAMSEGLAVAGTVSPDLPSGDLAFAVDDTGVASLGGYRMMGLDLGEGRRLHLGVTGPVQGLTVTTEPGVTEGSVRFGRSFVGALAGLLAGAGATDGTLGRRSAEIDADSAASQTRITALETRAAALEQRYLTRFAAMEQAVTRMKSTGSYIQNLVDLWSQKD